MEKTGAVSISDKFDHGATFLVVPPTSRNGFRSFDKLLKICGIPKACKVSNGEQ